MHLAIEQFLHGSPEQILPEVKDTPEWRYFMKFWDTFGSDLEPYRSEWEVFTDSLSPLEGERKIKLCGSIDMVFRRKSDGKFVIYVYHKTAKIKTPAFYKIKDFSKSTPDKLNPLTCDAKIVIEWLMTTYKIE